MTALLLAALLAVPAADSKLESPEVRLTTVRLTVSPAAEPKPALKYQLLPEVRELKPGNPVQWYVRCFMEQRNFFFRKDVVADRAKQRVMPLKDLPAEGLRNYGGSALTQADWGARLDTPDWQILDRVQTDGTDLRLPELPALRELAGALQLRFRGEVARRDFDDALRTAKTMFALARHLGDSPASAANRLGLEIAGMTLDTLLEMIQQPGCPNLYWAFTDLPCPIVELRKGAQGDRAAADTELRSLRAEAMTEADLEEVVSRVSGRVGYARAQAGKPPRNIRAELAARAKDAAAVTAARQRLIEAGVGKDAVAGFSALQVILLDEKLVFEVRRDDEFKLLGLKLWEIDSSLVQKKGAADGLFADLLPQLSEGRRAQGLLEQRIAILRHVEALRAYAAAHGGKLPEKLTDAGVPLPADPFTGKPFVYVLDGTTAKLRSTLSTSYEIVTGK